MQYLKALRCWNPGRGPRAAAWCAVACVLIAGCGSGESGGAGGTAPREEGVSAEYARGPVEVVLRASADTITTADTLAVTLEVTAEEGYSVKLPAYPEPEEADDPAGPAEPAFTLAGYEDAAPDLLDDGRVTRRRTFELEPFLAGDYTVPPLAVSFWAEGAEAEAKNLIETEPLPVTVSSVIAPGEDPSPKDIAGPVALREPPPWGLYALIALIAIAAAIGAWWYWFRYTPPGPPPAPVVPPHQRALEALESIRRSNLVEQGRYKEYYIRVSGVLRRYMEEQFQLRAPERTTEEFLDDLQHNAVLGLQEQLLLREFLRHCDLVKFARAEPTAEQIRETIETCERFIIDSEAAYRTSRLPSEAVGAGEG